LVEEAPVDTGGEIVSDYVLFAGRTPTDAMAESLNRERTETKD